MAPQPPSVTALVGLYLILAASMPQAQAVEESQESTDWPTVIAQLRQQMQQRPGHAPTRQQLAVAYNNYGVSLGNQGDWDSAIQQLQEALRLDGTNEQLRVNLGQLYLNQAQDAYQRHQLSEASDAVDHALALNPESARAFALRGEIEYSRQKLKEARIAWQQALALDPQQPELEKRLAQVSQELPIESQFERLSQAYFDLRYEEQLERPVGFDIRDALLQARRLVGSDVAYWPKHKIIVLIYSAESFRAIRQETPEWVAGQFDGKIRVPLPNGELNQAMATQIIFHEYTHAVVHELTNGRCPVWLNEGLAEYEGRTQLPGSLLRLAAAYQQQRLLPWDELSDSINPTLPAETVGLAYEQAYSLIAYLVERYGFWRIRRFLKAIGEGQAWDVVLVKETHLKLPKLEDAWREWLPTLLRKHASLS